nr:MAG TPA: hypothetical protein [Caudoviricetes sp.]
MISETISPALILHLPFSESIITQIYVTVNSKKINVYYQ